MTEEKAKEISSILGSIRKLEIKIESIQKCAEWIVIEKTGDIHIKIGFTGRSCDVGVDEIYRFLCSEFVRNENEVLLLKKSLQEL